MMYERIKNFVLAHYVAVTICIIVIITGCIWFYSERTSNINITGIHNAENELQHAREYNQQSIDYNKRAGDAIESSKAINERAEERIDTSIELNQRTENAIDRCKELVDKARADDIRAKDIISESRNILERANERNQQSENKTTKQ